MRKKLQASLKGVYEPKAPTLPEQGGRQLHRLDGPGPNRYDRWPAYTSEVAQAALVWIEAALARGVRLEADGDADDEIDLRLICKDAELTPRQTEVFCSIAEGFTLEEVARYMDISPSTVWAHLYRARAKLADAWPFRLDFCRDVG